MSFFDRELPRELSNGIVQSETEHDFASRRSTGFAAKFALGVEQLTDNWIRV